MKSRKAIRIKINDLLDVCQSCVKKPVNQNNAHMASVCGQCQTYHELKRLGEALTMKGDKDMEPLNISIEEYVEFKNQGLLDRQISQKMGLKKQQLANWKYARKEQINKAISQSQKEKAVSLTAPPVAYDWKSKYEKLLGNYKDLLKKFDGIENRYKEEIESLKRERGSLESQLAEKVESLEELKKKCEDMENVNAACEDVEDEIGQLRSQLYDTDYALEDYKKRVSDLNGDAFKLEHENKLMKELFKLWI